RTMRSCTERFALKARCGRCGESIRTEVHFDAGVYPQEDVRRWAREFHTALARALENPGQSLDEIDILDDSEPAQQLVAFNATEARRADHRLIHEWVESQARNVPDRAAVVSGDRSLSYGELDRRSNQLAHHLRGSGVGPEVPVALCVGASPEAIVG